MFTVSRQRLVLKDHTQVSLHRLVDFLLVIKGIGEISGKLAPPDHMRRFYKMNSLTGNSDYEFTPRVLPDWFLNVLLLSDSKPERCD